MSAKLLNAKSKEKCPVYKEKRELFRTDDAMIEVTVKLKKRKDKSKTRKEHHQHCNYIYDDEPLVHKTGSWGDLLLRKKKLAESQTTITNNLNNNVAPESDEQTCKQCCPRHVKSATTTKQELYIQTQTERPRVKVPITEDLILQTENPPRVREHEVSSKSSYQRRKARYVQSNHIKPKISHSSPNKLMTSRSNNHDQQQNDNVAPGVGGKAENIPKKTRLEDAQVQTVQQSLHGRNGDLDEPDNLQVLEDLKKLSALKVENDLLRQDTASLIQQVDKAKTERQEYITTIKELYELAEVLRHENVILIGTHEEHRTLQEKLIDALGENQVLKNRLQELTIELSKPPPQSVTNNKNKQPTEGTNKNEDLWKVRDVLKEVKTAIAQEIQGLKTVTVRRSPIATDDDDILELFGSLTGLTEPNGLNDTNAQCDYEIERILNVNNSNADRFDIRSSTQYLDVGDSETHVASRRFVPSPNSNASSISPRFSTPHSDDEI